MKFALCLSFLMVSLGVEAQIWKTLPEGVRILGYRNVQTSRINQNYNSSGAQDPIGPHFRIDAKTINSFTGNVLQPGVNIDPEAYNALLVGEYDIDANAQANVHGMGFGYGITNKVMFYGQLTFYKAQVHTKIKRTAGNTFQEVAAILGDGNGYGGNFFSNNYQNLMDVDESAIQTVIVDYYKYKPLGDWYGSGLGDLETGFMVNVIDRGVWGLMLYPGVVLPTGRQDDPDILQDIGFGDGQYDFFTEAATGYVHNDYLSFGTSLRYTYQAPTTKTLRAPSDPNFTLSSESEKFEVKYGDKINWMTSSTFHFNDWLSVTPMYRYMYQFESEFDSKNSVADKILAQNTEKSEHQAQLTTTLSSIAPYLKKQFVMPAQINFNIVRTVAGQNVPNVSRYEVELRMLF